MRKDAKSTERDSSKAAKTSVNLPTPASNKILAICPTTSWNSGKKDAARIFSVKESEATETPSTPHYVHLTSLESINFEEVFTFHLYAISSFLHLGRQKTLLHF